MHCPALLNICCFLICCCWDFHSEKCLINILENLLAHLVYFLQRTEPLQVVNGIFSKVETEFKEIGYVRDYQLMQTDKTHLENLDRKHCAKATHECEDNLKGIEAKWEDEEEETQAYWNQWRWWWIGKWTKIRPMRSHQFKKHNCGRRRGNF